MKLLVYLQRAMQIVCTVTLAAMSVVVFIQVINRNMFNQSFVWVEELSSLCMVWITFLGAALATSFNTHTRIDFFIRLFPEKVTRFINIFDHLACFAFVMVLSYHSFPLITFNMKNLSATLRFPLALNYIGLFVSALLMALYFLVYVYVEFREIQGKETQLRKELSAE